jgi:hypothetical protein
VHGHMLEFALRHGLLREALGQITRLLLAAPLSLVGLIPAGNTGGSNVSGLRPMPVPAELQHLIDDARARASWGMRLWTTGSPTRCPLSWRGACVRRGPAGLAARRSSSES